MEKWIYELYWFILKRGYKISDLGVGPEGYVFYWDDEEQPGIGPDSGVLTVKEWINALQQNGNTTLDRDDIPVSLKRSSGK